MRAAELIGKRIADVRLKVTPHDKVGWLDECDAWIVLDDGTVVGFPWSLDEEIRTREHPVDARSAFHQTHWLDRALGALILWWRLRTAGTGTKVMVEHRKVFLEARDRMVIDLLIFDDAEQKAFVQLDNGWLITHVPTAPHGTGHANVHFYQDVSEAVRRHGEPTARATTARPG